MGKSINSLSLYIHIPFCHSRCNYCDFYSNCFKKNDEAIFVQSILEQWKIWKENFPYNDLYTVYIGGGTPSLLSSKSLESLSSIWEKWQPQEITIEANPESINRDFITTLKTIGIQRISLGIQSFDDRLLQAMGRPYRKNKLIRSLDMIKQNWEGFLSGDLIYGYPDTDLDQWIMDAEEFNTWDIEHLSLYQLTLEEGTPLSEKLSSGKQVNHWRQKQDEGWPILRQKIESLGYERYEISNFTKGSPSLHNQVYWKMDPWIGLGPGAASFLYFEDQAFHVHNQANLERFIQGTGKMEMKDSFYEYSYLSKKDFLIEIFMMGLRMKKGLKLKRIKDLGYSIPSAENIFPGLQKKGFLEHTGDTLRPTEKGMDFHNVVLLEIMDQLSPWLVDCSDC